MIESNVRKFHFIWRPILVHRMTLVSFRFPRKVEKLAGIFWENGSYPLPCQKIDCPYAYGDKTCTDPPFVYTRYPRNSASFWTANGTATCNRICTVPCKRVAQVKNSSLQKFVRTSVKRGLGHFFEKYTGRIDKTRQKATFIVWVNHFITRKVSFIKSKPFFYSSWCELLWPEEFYRFLVFCWLLTLSLRQS